MGWLNIHDGGEFLLQRPWQNFANVQVGVHPNIYPKHIFVITTQLLIFFNQPTFGMDRKNALSCVPFLLKIQVKLNHPSLSSHLKVASKRLDEGAWFLLESPVVCWPLTQQEGGRGC